jgi:hypothetical protein
MATAVDPYDLRSGKVDPPKLIDDVDRLVANLQETFELRHILAHEAANSLTVDRDRCDRLLSAVEMWIEGVDAVLWATVLRDVPLTQPEINRNAYDRVLVARDKLAKAMKTALRAARSEGSTSWLRNNHFAWMANTKSWTSGGYRRQGTIWAAIESSELARLIEARAEHVLNWAKAIRPDEHVEET